MMKFCVLRFFRISNIKTKLFAPETGPKPKSKLKAKLEQNILNEQIAPGRSAEVCFTYFSTPKSGSWSEQSSKLRCTSISYFAFQAIALSEEALAFA